MVLEGTQCVICLSHLIYESVQQHTVVRVVKKVSNLPF